MRFARGIDCRVGKLMLIRTCVVRLVKLGRSNPINGHFYYADTLHAQLTPAKIKPPPIPLFDHIGQQKTYNSGYSLVVTHLTTNPPVRCLNRAERTGSLVFNVLWSYVLVSSVDRLISTFAIVGGAINTNHHHTFIP
jgi:hypothetical protein